MFYTLDQSEPTQKSQKGDRVVITQPLTIKAIAVLGGIVSEVSSASFTVSKSSADGVEGFVKVTDQSMLEDGDVLIILNEEYQVALGKTGKNNRYFFDTLKNGKTRIVAPAPIVFDVLRKVRKEQAENRLKYGTSYNNEMNLVFTISVKNPDGCRFYISLPLFVFAKVIGKVKAYFACDKVIVVSW